MSFVVLALLFSAALYGLRAAVPFRAGSGFFQWSETSFDFLRMASVGVAGVISLLGVEGSVAGLGLRRAGGRYLLLGAAIPAVYGAAIYGLAWALGLASFRGGSVLALSVGAAFVHAPMHSLAALGEEIGWRGVLTPALSISAGPRLASVLCGLLWAAWHCVDIFFFGYRSGLFLPFEIACFTLALIGLSVFLAWLRYAAASLWPCVLLHAAHNLSIYGVFERASDTHAHAEALTGEFGLGFAVAGLALGAFGWLKLGRP